ncbi:MAG TPA: hypothetical protein VJK90_04360 [Acetobacteraceae bacterium]|jgi:hypothetical protein|nr:hypothetical protein [Acetobacteraceae bacterium]
MWLASRDFAPPQPLIRSATATIDVRANALVVRIGDIRALSHQIGGNRTVGKVRDEGMTARDA